MMMFSRAQRTIAAKDMREAMSNKMIKFTMIFVPIILVVMLPGMFTVIALMDPAGMEDFSQVARMLPIKFSIDQMIQASYYYLMNYLSPAFFLIVPIMASSVAAGSSFVGEKERRTLETLLFSPLTVNELFFAKVMGSVTVAMIVTGFAFLAYLAVAIVGSVLIYGSFVLNTAIWLIILLLIVPAISLIGVTAIVLASARAHTFQEAQQYAAVLIVPVMLFFIMPQVTGLFLYDWPQLLLIGAGIAAVGFALTRIASARFTPEKLLK